MARDARGGAPPTEIAMFRSLFSRRTKTTPQAIRRPARSARRAQLGVEMLEGREVPATMIVNGAGDTIAADGLLTLREAVSLNTGAITYNQLSAAEKTQVSGMIGNNDLIKFAFNGNINLTGDLPTLTKKLTI